MARFSSHCFVLFIDIFFGIYSYIFAMRVYFLSSRPCALKINGEYLGETDGFERYVNLFPRERPFVEWIPRGDALPISFFLTEDILFAPPRGIALYHAQNFLVVYAKDFRFYAPLTLLAATPSVTVFSQGIPQVLHRNEVVTLSDPFSSCKISEYGNVVLLEGVGALCALFNASVVFNGEAEEWRFDPERQELTVTFPVRDFCGGRATCVWVFAEGRATLLRAEKTKAEWSAPVLCRFLQDLLLQRESGLLSAELASSLPRLKEYLGDYSAVFPAYSETTALVACPMRERVFSLKCFSAELAEGKISNIRREW
jgi:hypothetical protein